MDNQYGGIAHCTLRKGIICKAVKHKAVSELWHVLSGKGEIWRSDNLGESVTPFEAGMTIDIPLGADFQYRSTEIDFVFICVTVPPRTGAYSLALPINVLGAAEAAIRLVGFCQ